MTGGLLKTHHDRLLDHLRSHSMVELYDSLECSPAFQLVPQLTTTMKTGASPGAHAGHGAEDRQYGLQVQCRGAGWDFSWANGTGRSSIFCSQFLR